MGTPDYIAPEVIGERPPFCACAPSCYRECAQRAVCAAAECDWWSFGVIAFECLCGYTPFYADDPKEEIRRIKNWEQHLVGGAQR